jgi:PAS domain-containing protein
MVTLRTGEPLTGVIMGVHKPDGSLTRISINSRAVVEAGQTVGVLSTFSDVTAQKNSEVALRISEERWKLAMEGARDGIWDRNLDTGKVFFSRRTVVSRPYGLGAVQ